MSKPLIFISCGQFTEAEKSLGNAIAKMVKSVTGFDAFFAEQVQDLNGLDTNILAALRDCAAFIAVMHPRGKITRPAGEIHVRASVWIEQEIAIATYIQRIEKRQLPVIAFIHESIGREGIRDLLHLNPIPFSHDTEVLTALMERLEPWKQLKPYGVRVELRKVKQSLQADHWTSAMQVVLVNESNERITKYNCLIRVPYGLLKHWVASYRGEESSSDPRFRTFRGDETETGQVSPRTEKVIYSFEYCPQCAGTETREIPPIATAIVRELMIETKVWIDGKEYGDSKTVEQLAR